MGNYSTLKGLQVTAKDGAGNVLAAAAGAVVTILTQVVAQCPDLTITLGTFGVSSLGFKAIIRFLANYEKHKDGTSN